MKKVLINIRDFLVFFSLVAFVISCCLILFTSTLQDTIGRDFTREEITLAAKATMMNVILISAGMAVFDHIRRKLTIERPLKKITDATEKIMQGDFSVRIDHRKSLVDDGNFALIGESLNKMAQELGSVETLRTDFISNVSHELKTPLAVMQNYGTMLQTPDLSEEKRIEYAKGITDNSRRLAALITNILKLNKLENQQIFPTCEKYDLSNQLCECLLQFEEVWEEKNIEIETELEDDVYIASDEELLALVWSNLFSNAFKFTEDNGRVTVSLTADEEYAVVRISDTGCGISAETGKHIFEKFYQGDTSHATQGNGLGLALVKRVIDICKGEITVFSEAGKGSTFTVRLKRGGCLEAQKAD